jgi:predicted PurR-regulated permease PerM
MNSSPPPFERWSNRRILWLLGVGTLLVSAVWRLPEEASYLSHRTGELFFTLVIAMALTYLLRPGVNFLERAPLFAKARGGRLWATALVFVLAIVLIYLFFTVGMRPIANDLSGVKKFFVALDPIRRRSLIDFWQLKLNTIIGPYLAVLAPGTDIQIDRDIPRAIASFAPAAQAIAKRALSHVGFIVELLLIPVLVFYFLCDGAAIRREAELLLPHSQRPRADRVLAHLDRILDGYIRGQVWMCLIAWVLVTLGLWALRVPHAVTMGLIAGLTRAIPVVGPLLGGIPLVLLCLAATGSMQTTMIVLVGFIVMHFLESKVLLPKIIGHEVDLHPVSVIVALLLGMEFFGFLGVFLAVPAAAIAKTLLSEWHDARAAQHAWKLAAQNETSASTREPENVAT